MTRPDQHVCLMALWLLAVCGWGLWLTQRIEGGLR